MIFVAFVLVLVIAGRVLAPCNAAARDLDGRYANSPLKSWFESLHSSKGPCCSDADGTALSDVDWEAKDGHYRVRIEGQWWDVPDEAVIKEPNQAARTMVWPIYYRGIGMPLRIDIRQRCPVSVGAARALARVQALEPAFEGRVGIAAIEIARGRFVGCQNAASDHKDKNKRHKDHPVSQTYL